MLHDRVDILSSRVATAYRRLASLDPSPVAPGACCADPAVAWVAELAAAGRPLPVNAATEHALQAAATRMSELSLLAEAVHGTIGR